MAIGEIWHGEGNQGLLFPIELLRMHIPKLGGSEIPYRHKDCHSLFGLLNVVTV